MIGSLETKSEYSSIWLSSHVRKHFLLYTWPDCQILHINNVHSIFKEYALQGEYFCREKSVTRLCGAVKWILVETSVFGSSNALRNVNNS